MNKILVYSSPAKSHKIIVFNEDTKEIQEQTNVSSLKQLYPTILIKSKTYDANSITFTGPRIYTSKLADNLKLAEFATYSTNNLHIELR